MGYVSIRIDESAAGVLNQKVAETGMTKSQVIIEGCKGIKNGGERLLEELDRQSEHPEDYIPEEDKAILRSVGPGELPECCQTIFDDPEHPTPTCKHWRQAYENYYGQKMWGYVNDLVGGGYRTWFSKYVK